MSDTHLSEPAKVGAPATKPRRRGRGLVFQIAAVALTVVSALAGTGLARWLRGPDATPTTGGQPARLFPNRVLTDWKKPDLVVLLSGQLDGYLLPCGCSRPQIGGLERRYNFIQMIKAAGWPYAAVDLGDLIQRHPPAKLPNQQALIKYIYSMRAFKEMDYSAVGFGANETNLGLFNVLAEYALNDPKPRVVMGNLIEADKNFPGMIEPWEAIQPLGSTIKVGATTIIGPTVATQIKTATRNDPNLRFESTPNALDRIIPAMAAKGVNLPILLFQGPLTINPGKKPFREAMACAEAYPQFPIIVCHSEEDDPPSRPVEVTTKAGTKSLVVSLGTKGKFIGVVGVYKTGNPARPLEFKYERVELSEDFLTPAGKEKNHPVIDLMEAYTRELKDKNYLQKYGQVRHSSQILPKVPGLQRDVPVTYVGSEVCKRCHEDAYDIWKKTPHSHAYKTLVDAKSPGNRQYDPECIVCHTVGFGNVSGFVSDTATPKLKDVGCEACHGPASVHVQNPNDTTWHQRINPWKYLPANKRQDATDQFCQKCHDQDNDVTWIHGGFQRKWPKVAHPTPKQPEEK